MMYQVTLGIGVVVPLLGIVASASVGRPDFEPEPVFQRDKKIISPSTVFLNQCPVTDDEKLLREFQFGTPCPKDKPYVCGQDMENKYIVEQCHEPISCNAGSAPTTVVNDQKGTFVMMCKDCSSTKYQPFPVSTADQPADGCHLNRQINALNQEGIVMIDPGSTTTMANFTCDYLNLYFDEYGQMYCDNNRQCECISGINRCNSSHPDLLPNGDCEKSCGGRRAVHQNFVCIAVSERSPPATVKTSPTSTLGIPPNDTTPLSTPLPTDGPGKADGEPSSSIGTIVLIVGGVVVVLLLILILVLWKRQQNAASLRKNSTELSLTSVTSSEGTIDGFKANTPLMSDHKDSTADATRAPVNDEEGERAPEGNNGAGAPENDEEGGCGNKNEASKPSMVVQNNYNIVVKGNDNRFVVDGHLIGSQNSNDSSVSSVLETDEVNQREQEAVRDTAASTVDHDPDNEDLRRAFPVLPIPNETAHDASNVRPQVAGPVQQPTDANADGGAL